MKEQVDMAEPVSPERLAWAIDARARSQRLLLALYEFGVRNDYGSRDASHDAENQTSQVFSLLVGVAFSLWRAAFLAEMPTRTWPHALYDAHQILKAVLSTNTIAFSTEHERQGWTGGYYLANAKLRLQDVSRRLGKRGGVTDADVARLESISLMNTDPHHTWKQFCAEAERLAQQIGCEISA